jgi:hypothetical protein
VDLEITSTVTTTKKELVKNATELEGNLYDHPEPGSSGSEEG